ncbi:MAG TPA: ABC transporter permease [Candidatus Ornithocaccomicrobium faecavium]|uniref:ABC transporter permease n=1 Tax=Candidatus Ornithocaccomicrobium faecavium TaxID=2840890 RepID=A0A9D1P746_9FIRM|nr:ABC transporter permease [Candidatus Ornithocaccomicrobium faecavium]
MLGESVKMAWENIVANKMRSFLTTLGIIIGVMAIIALITIVQAATAEVTNQFAELGTGKVTITVQGTALKAGLTESDLSALAAVDNVGGIAPNMSLTLPVSAGGQWEEEVSVEGRGAVYFRENGDLVARGRALNALDEESRNCVCLIDEKLMEKLFFAQDPLGQKLYIDGMEFTVVGVLATDEDRDVMAQLMGGGDNGKLIMPYTSAMRLTNMHSVTNVEVYIQDTDYTDQTVDDLETVLNAAFNYKNDSYSVINMESLLDTMNMMMDVMTGLLAGIASISLLVGGIGIMNMMLVSVTERTTEIGLRKALGAQPRQIQLQFLIESFVLSVLGGLIGLILGLAVSYYFSGYMDIPFRISSFAISLGLGFSAAVGVIFGWAPARKASRLDPIDALRSM